MDARMAVSRLAAELKPLGYYRKGNAFFAIQGKDVLVSLKMEYERRVGQHILCFGLMSLYEEIMPHELSSFGCVTPYRSLEYLHPQYYDFRISGRPEGDMFILEYPGGTPVRVSIEDWIRESRSPEGNMITKRMFEERYAPMVQVERFIEHVLPVLRDINTQEDICNVVLRFDKRRIKTRMIHSLLSCGRYSEALEIIQEILEQNRRAMKSNGIDPSKRSNDLWYARYLQLEQLILQKQDAEIQVYLSGNFKRNTELFSNTFCKRKKAPI